MDALPIPAGIDDLTAEWLTAVLGERFGAKVQSVDARPVGTGQVADSVRLTLEWEPAGAGPPSLVAKVTAASATSREAAISTRTYEVEVGFYRDLAPTLPVHTPYCYHAANEPGTAPYVVLLEDAAPAVQGDQMAGCSVDEAAAALDEAALLHGSRWGDPALAGLAWLNRRAESHPADMAAFVRMMLPQFFDRYRDRLSPEVTAVAERLDTYLESYFTRPQPRTVAHGDFRVDNLLFGRERVFVLDWQTVGLGPALSDVSYFLGASLSVADRQAHEDALVRHYHERVVAAGADMSWDDCWLDYRRFALDSLVMAVVASILVGQTDRGDDMFMAMAERSGELAVDLETERLYLA